MKKLITILGVFVLIAGGPLSLSRFALAQGAELRAQLVSTNSPVTAKVGTEVQFTVEVKNTGTATWSNSGNNPLNLGTIRPIDHKSRFWTQGWIGDNRPATMQETAIAPGETAHFVFSAVATGKGKVTDNFGLVMERVAWLNLVIPLTINVQPAVFKGELVSQSTSTIELKAQESATVTVNVKNTGDIVWANGGAGAIKIGTSAPYDRTSNFYHSSWLSKNRVVSAGTAIQPGSSGDFVFTVQAPKKTGTFREEFSLVAEGTAWIPLKFSLTMKVVPAIWSAELVNQSAGDVSVAPGDTATLWVEIKNTGNTVWKSDGLNAVKLGTARSLDRSSVFQDSSWLSKNRVVTASSIEVAPGAVGRFEFTIKAPNKIGKYTEYFRPVAEGITWLNDSGLHWNFAVEEELTIKDPIRVGITSTTDSITVQGDSFVIRRGSDKGLVKKVSGSSITATAFNGGYSLNTGESVNDWLRFIPLNKTLLTVKTSGIGNSYNTFRGVIDVRRSSLSGNVWVVNVLEFEDYMKGIAEVPEGWPVEAQKAQMVAARTYATTKLTAPVADIFDIYDDTRDQVYYGYDYEESRPGLCAAAEATRGVIIRYNGTPISAYYFSDSGGYTENVENVWTKTIPYLRAVPDPYAKPIEWTATLTQDYLQTRFNETLNMAPGTDVITGVAVTERFPSSRVKTVTFTLQSGRTVPVSSKTFDYLTNGNEIKSMKFDVVPSGTDFVFSGQGWGHGVGMAQWGAKNMALQGKSYQEILTYYYTGVTVSSR